MNEKPLIYAVDDEPSILELYALAFENAGFDYACFSGGDALMKGVNERLPSLFVLDVMLDGMDGFEILSKLRKDVKTAFIPVIMVSAKGEEMSKVKGLNLGADDYISKPFGVMEFIARINANLRRRNVASDIYSFKDISVNDGKHSVSIGAESITLTLKEYELLKFLINNADKVLSREKILNAVWGDNYFGETRTLDIHIASLRRAIAHSSAEIVTIRGVGYQLK